MGRRDWAGEKVASLFHSKSRWAEAGNQRAARHAMPRYGGPPALAQSQIIQSLKQKVVLIERERPIQVVLPLGSGPERRLVRDNDQLILIAQLLAC